MFDFLPEPFGDPFDGEHEIGDLWTLMLFQRLMDRRRAEEEARQREDQDSWKNPLDRFSNRGESTDTGTLYEDDEDDDEYEDDYDDADMDDYDLDDDYDDRD